MSRKFFLFLILSGLVFSTSIYSACPAMDSLLSAAKKAKDDAIAGRLKAWKDYTGNCGAGKATSNAGEEGDGGKGNMCAYKSGGEFRYVYKDNTIPVTNCDSLTCFDASLLGYIGGAIDSIISYIGVDGLTDGILADATLTGQCVAACKSWFAFDEAIPGLQQAITELEAQESVICSSPCNGMTGEAYNKCECGRKDTKIWTWDESKNPKQCVACKDKEGSGNEYNKCMCINAQEGFWYEKENACVGKACASKPVGLELDKCICEIEKKLVWHVKRKVCNYVPAAGSAPGLTPSGSEGEGDGLGGGAGYTAEGAAAGGASGGGSSGSDSSATGAGGAEQGEANNADKEKSVPWYKGLFGPMGFGSSGPVGSYSGAPQNNAGSKTKSTPATGAGINKVAPTDIMPKDSDDIFANLSENYNKRYQARILSGAGI